MVANAKVIHSASAAKSSAHMSQSIDAKNKSRSFTDNRPETSLQNRVNQLSSHSQQVKQYKTYQRMADARSSWQMQSVSPQEVMQRAIDVGVEIRKGSVVIADSGFVSEYQGGTDAVSYGWNGVEKYKAEAKVANNKPIVLNEINNNYRAAEAGHVLAKQNGGKGHDPNNVFAQDGGVNNGPFRTDFENPMRRQLNYAQQDDDVLFRAVLYGKNITQGPLIKRGDDLYDSSEDTDFEGF